MRMNLVTIVGDNNTYMGYTNEYVRRILGIFRTKKEVINKVIPELVKSDTRYNIYKYKNRGGVGLVTNIEFIKNNWDFTIKIIPFDTKKKNK